MFSHLKCLGAQPLNTVHPYCKHMVVCVMFERMGAPCTRRACFDGMVYSFGCCALGWCTIISIQRYTCICYVHISNWRELFFF